MTHFRYCFIIILSVGLFAHAQPTRKHIKLDEGWKFHFGNASDPQKDFNYAIDPFFYKTLKETKSVINTNFNDTNWRMDLIIVNLAWPIITKTILIN